MDVGADLVSVLLAVVAEAPLAFPMADISDTVFFSVTSANPEKRQATPVHHVAPRNDRVHVAVHAVMSGSGDEPREMKVLLFAANRAVRLSLLPLIGNMAVLAPTFFQWEVAGKHSTPTLRRTVAAWTYSTILALSGCSEPHGTLAVGRAGVGDAALQLALPAVDDMMASQILAQVSERCAAQQVGNVEVLALEDVPLVVVDHLVEHGALSREIDELGVVSVSPLPEGIRWTSATTVGQPLQVHRVGSYSASSKLDMALHLARAGWRAMPEPAALSPGGPREFRLEVRRPASYFLALLNWEELVRKKVTELRHDGPDYYYRCLLKLGEQQIIAMLRLGENGNAFFLKQLRDGMPSAPNAIIHEVGEEEMGEDPSAGWRRRTPGAAVAACALAASPRRRWLEAVLCHEGRLRHGANGNSQSLLRQLP